MIMITKFTDKQRERFNIQKTDAEVIGELADQHPANPSGFINSLDGFFHNMCVVMVNNRKGGRI